MKTNLVKIAMLGLVAAALTFTPTISRAQDATTNTPSATPKKTGPIPFQGKVVAVDTAAQTLTVGKRTLTITPTTKFLNVTNTTATVTLADLTVGEAVTGSYKTAADGKTLNAYSVHIGGKAKHKKKPAPATSDSTSTGTGSN